MCWEAPPWFHPDQMHLLQSTVTHVRFQNSCLLSEIGMLKTRRQGLQTMKIISEVITREMEVAAYCCVRCRKGENIISHSGGTRHPQYNSLNNAACDWELRHRYQLNVILSDTRIARRLLALKNKQAEISHIKRNPWFSYKAERGRLGP